MPYEWPQLPNEESAPEEEAVSSSTNESFGFDIETDFSRLSKYWKTHAIPGQPPSKGSIAHKRLHDSCQKYAHVVRNQGNIEVVGRIQPDAEDYFASKTGRMVGRSSDRYRRELHNEIAIMLYGRPRSGMETDLAEHIMEFALHYIPE